MPSNITKPVLLILILLTLLGFGLYFFSGTIKKKMDEKRTQLKLPVDAEMVEITRYSFFEKDPISVRKECIDGKLWLINNKGFMVQVYDTNNLPESCNN